MSSNQPDIPRKVVVVGAGPVGCLAAIAFAKMGWLVEIYEGRADLRLPSSKAAAQHRSINLAISSRGIAALQAIDPAATERFLQTVIPMRGRMIHDSKGGQQSQLYDRHGQCINSIDRALLNEGLLEEASSIHNIKLFFRHKVISVDFDNKTMSVQNIETKDDIQVQFDLCIGADGSYSVIKRQLMRVVRMDYQQEYIPHEYIELKMPAGRDKDGQARFLLDPNHLHIWPRHSFMLIALPNKDKSFTCTLFAPTAEFDRLTSDTIVAWFKSYFPDALAIIGEETLRKDFERNPRSPLISTKLKPYHFSDRAILLGDAAHSMVPFYGQGLNCGFEDVRILVTFMREGGVESHVKPLIKKTSESLVDQRLAQVLGRYSDCRHEDLVAICELAMDNYVEMRHSVTTPLYMVKKTLDNMLFSLSSRRNITLDSLGSILSRVAYPPGQSSGWLPLYTMVTFRPDISYATARRKAARQQLILAIIGWLGSSAAGIALAWMVFLRRTCRRR